MKRLFSVILAVIFALSLCGCVNELPDSSGDISFLLLGDSIADGYSVADNPSYQYANKVAQKMGYTLINDAVSGDDTDDLLTKIQDETATQQHIRHADIIGISIGGNNLLHLSAAKIAKLTVQGADGDEAKALLSGLKKGVSDIFGEIRKLNEKSPIYLQTVYNPFCGTSNVLYKAFEPTVAQLSKKAKAIFEEICSADKNAKTVDIYSLFKAHYDETEKTDYIFTDCIHPSKAGNDVIANEYINQFTADTNSGKLPKPTSYESHPLKSDCKISARYEMSSAAKDDNSVVFSGESGKACDGILLSGDIPKKAIGITFSVQASQTDRLGVMGLCGETAEDEHIFDTDSVYRVSSDETTQVRVIFGDHFSVNDGEDAPKIESLLIYLKIGGNNCTLSDIRYIIGE